MLISVKLFKIMCTTGIFMYNTKINIYNVVTPIRKTVP